jgi:small subunit ribosomal protein S18
MTFMPKRYKDDAPAFFDYRDAKTLLKFVNMYGQIEPISKTGLSAKQQRQLSTAIKRARHLALMPFVAQG